MAKRIAFTACLAIAVSCLFGLQAEAGYSVKFVVSGWVGPTQQDSWCAQLDGDAQLEFVVLIPDGDRVSIYDGLTGAEEFLAEFSLANPTNASCTIIDVDGDGFLEVLVRAQWAMSPSGTTARTMVIDTDATGSVQEDVVGSALLGQNSPNPFTPATDIRFVLATASAIELKIYDVGGRMVRTVAEGRFEAGTHALRWDGRAERGEDLAPGVYYYELVTPEGRQAKKAILLK